VLFINIARLICDDDEIERSSRRRNLSNYPVRGNVCTRDCSKRSHRSDRNVLESGNSTSCAATHRPGKLISTDYRSVDLAPFELARCPQLAWKVRRKRSNVSYRERDDARKDVRWGRKRREKERQRGKREGEQAAVR